MKVCIVIVLVLFNCLATSLFAVESIKKTRVLRERGRVVSQGRQGVSSRIRGVILRLKPTGTPVKKGDFLFELDVNQLEEARDLKTEALERFKREILEKEVSMKEKQELYSLKAKWLSDKVAHQKLQYDMVARELPEVEERIGTIPLEITQLKLEEAKEELKRQERIIEAGFAAPNSITSKELRMNSLELQLLKDKQSIKVLKEGASLEEELELKIKLKTAEDEMNRQQAEHDHEINVLKSQLKELYVELKHDSIQLDVLNQNLKYSIGYAERDGIWVLKRYRDWWQGGVWRDMNLGKNVGEYQVVGDLIDPHVLNIEVLIHEADRSKIAIDQECELYFPALKKPKVKGRLSSISEIAKDRLDLAESGEESSHSRYGLFQVFIKLETELEGLKPGMSSTIYIPYEVEVKK